MKEFLIKNNVIIQKLAKKYETCPNIHKDDHIFRFIVTNPRFRSVEDAIEYYFRDGQNSSRIIMNLIKELYQCEKEKVKMLEFASGYGCVTRHLLNQKELLDITSCDIHPQAINFIEKELGGEVLLSDSKPENANLKPNSYDIVFCLSFFSHMPESTWFRWLSKLYEALVQGGLLVFTTHGYQSKKYFEFAKPVFDEKGYWFLPASEQLDLDVQEYGQTLVSPAYVCSKIKLLPDNPIIVKAVEGLWWGHQDLWVVQKEVFKKGQK